MAVNIRLNIDVDMDDTMRMLNGMEGRSTNFRPVFWYARSELEKANAANFTSSGLPVGGWAPRSQPYAWPIMRQTGALFRSLTSMRGAPNDIGRKSAIFGTNVEYAKYHQRGTWKMPKRAVVFEPPLFARRLGIVAAQYVVDGSVPD